ncbi:unnamed protein product [Rotaria sp. Silwood2]|nr:unnamed protein product [Rotaria sp. Silwood2]CAF3083965.1 unnamed protein product [Rotaria sp. Silwood2]CAF3204298.1 unnamed protein product [Rotaria sp. Silwood2]CAF4257140.1 unnamed protein product [Rotaria sp. Silwood2]CAF4382381.1 unnamed protein product [Rotaria sp. Silwood2]
MIHKREPNARWVNQYNEELLRAWNANMDIQFVLDPYACAKYLMSYTTKPEREMSLLLEATHKECREGSMPKNTFIDLKQTYRTTDEMRPLLESMNEEQQEIFYHVREWCINRLHNPDIEPLRLFITGGAGTAKSHLLKCLHYEATKIFSRKKHLEPDENIDEIHTLITAFTLIICLVIN